MPEDFSTLINQHLDNDILPKKGTIIETEILQINSEFIVVNVGAKQEGFISRKEFKTIPSVGDTIKVFVESASPSHIKLSFTKAAKFDNIAILEDKMNKEESVEGTIQKLTPNGYLVNIMDWEAFLPFSQVLESGVLKEEDKKKYVNQKYPFFILKMDTHRNKQSILVSRKKAQLSLRKESMAQFLDQVQVGSILNGKIVKINEKSVLIEVAENVVGLVPIGHVSWDHINHPSDKLTLNTNVNVKVIDKDLEKKTMLLSIKEANQGVLDAFYQTHSVGSVVKAKVLLIKEHFLVLWLQEGVKGILNRSNMAWGVVSGSLNKIYKVDDIIECKIIEMDAANHRISLGLKQMSEDPFLEFEKNYSVGSEVKGTVIKKTTFSIFIDLGNQIHAMIHKNDLSWNINEQNLALYKEGDVVECRILKIDSENKKVSCTLKSEGNNVWKTFGDKHPVNSIVKAQVVAEEDQGFRLLLDNLIETSLSFNHIPKGKTIQVGDTVDVLITYFVAYKNLIKVSIKALENKKQQEILDDYNTSSNAVKAPTLGDIFNFKNKS